MNLTEMSDDSHNGNDSAYFSGIRSSAAHIVCRSGQMQAANYPLRLHNEQYHLLITLYNVCSVYRGMFSTSGCSVHWGIS